MAEDTNESTPQPPLPSDTTTTDASKVTSRPATTPDVASVTPIAEVDYRNRVIASRILAQDWIARERREYADVKFDTEKRRALELDMHAFGLTEDGQWWTFLTNQLRRAQLFGPDTLQGRQAFGKLILVCLDAFEAMIRSEGPPPYPGVRSGDIRPWNR